MQIDIFHVSSATAEARSNSPTCAIVGEELLGLFYFSFKPYCVYDYTHLSLLICLYD